MKSGYFVLPVWLLGCVLVSAQGPKVKFADPVLYAGTGGCGTALVVTDVNHDGKLDLVLGCTDSVNVLLGNGDGTFQPAVEYAGGGATPNSLQVADINRDGNPDIVAGNASEVDVYLGNGDGTFQAAVVTPNLFATGLSVGDADGDGFPDLILSGVGFSYSGVIVMPGNGDGTFRSGILTPTQIGSEYVATADLNHDGKLDVAIVTDPGYIHDKVVERAVMGIMFGNGDGTFQQPVTYASGGFYPTQISITQVDGASGILLVDQRAKNPFKGYFNLYVTDPRGSVDGGFGGQFAGAGFAAAVGDLNVDGFPDVLNGNGALFLDGSFQHLYVGGGAVAIADLNGDGQPDIVTTHGGGADVFLSADFSSQTKVTSSANPSTAGEAVTFDSVTTSSRGPVANGVVVTFFDGTRALGTAVTANGGQASFTTTALAAGNHSIKAQFGGCAFIKESKGAVKQVVNP
ncbi:MAG: FG-GAP-like repeat-containing protein [Terriglobales bacterium]|jgi:hypothetical protein